MRLLFLSRWFPYPADNGTRIRIFNLLKHLALRHEVTLVSFAEGDGAGSACAVLEAFCSAVYTVAYKGFQPHRWKAVAGLWSRRPRSVVDTYSQTMARLVQSVAAQVKPELVVASEIDMAPYSLVVAGARRMLEDVELAVPAEAARRAPTRLARARHTLTWWKHARYVRETLQQFCGCTVVSAQEHRLVRQLAPASLPVRIIPNGVDLNLFSGDFGTPRPNTLIYTGALTYAANLDAMHYFVNDILPRVLVQQPDARLAITGSTAGIAAEQLPLHAHVDLTGYLPDIRPALAESLLGIVPLRIGGGTRLKILESLALGTPVVTTSKGLEGLDIAPGQGVLVADEPDAFAGAVVQILRDPELRAALRTAGREVVAKYDWARIGPELTTFVEELANTNGQHAE